MQIEYVKAIVAAIWIALVCGAGVVAHITSPSTWIFLALCAVLPPLVMLRYWKYPDQSLSESINEARR